MNRNWALFYREEGDRPSHFSEVRLGNLDVRVRTGLVSSGGTCKKRKHKGDENALKLFDQACAEQLEAGFVLTREGVYDPAIFDFEQLTVEIREGARKAFSAIREAHLDETINAYALHRDHGAMTIMHCANSEQRLRDVDESYVWNCQEWYFDEGHEFLDIAYRLILTQHQDLPSEVEWDDFVDGFDESCICALEQLIEEGFFGTEQERENVIILYQLSDLPTEQAEATRRLNTKTMYQRYRKWWDSWNEPSTSAETQARSEKQITVSSERAQGQELSGGKKKSAPLSEKGMANRILHKVKKMPVDPRWAVIGDPLVDSRVDLKNLPESIGRPLILVFRDDDCWTVIGSHGVTGVFASERSTVSGSEFIGAESEKWKESGKKFNILNVKTDSGNYRYWFPSGDFEIFWNIVNIFGI